MVENYKPINLEKGDQNETLSSDDNTANIVEQKILKNRRNVFVKSVGGSQMLAQYSWRLPR